jgi:hypothetical protein
LVAAARRASNVFVGSELVDVIASHLGRELRA